MIRKATFRSANTVSGPLISLVAFFLFASCGSPGAAPEDVAGDFWEAMRVDDRERAARFVTRDSLRLLDGLAPANDLEKVLLGEVLKNETSAIVRTSMITRENEIDLNIVFHTHLLLDEDEWKVDLSATQQEVTRATFGAGMKLIGEAIGQGIEEFGQALEQGAAEMREALREAVDELATPEDPQL